MQTFGLLTIYIFRDWLSDTQQARALSMADVAAVQQVPNVEQASPVIDQNGIIVHGRHIGHRQRPGLLGVGQPFPEDVDGAQPEGLQL